MAIRALIRTIENATISGGGKVGKAYGSVQRSSFVELTKDPFSSVEFWLLPNDERALGTKTG
jgi:hypothetical protein